MKFIDSILDGFKRVGDWIVTGFSWLFDLLAKPLTLLFQLLEGIFYFFMVLFEVVVKVIMIFVACFQFIGSLIVGVFRSIASFLTVSPSSSVYFPNASQKGFSTIMELLQGTGLLTIVPMIALAFVWFGFVIKMIGLFGGSIYINPLGRGGKD